MRLLRKLSLKTFHLHQNFSNKISYSFNQIKECAETFFLGIEVTTRNPFSLKNTIRVEEIENGEIPRELVTVGGGGRGRGGVVTVLSQNTETKTQGALIGSE